MKYYYLILLIGIFCLITIARYSILGTVFLLFSVITLYPLAFVVSEFFNLFSFRNNIPVVMIVHLFETSTSFVTLPFMLLEFYLLFGYYC